MKLEEVLPAMRAGRVAVGPDECQYRIVAGGAEYMAPAYAKWYPAYYFPAGDGWTLEPEPKVEWPKGSIQKALESKDPGSEARIIRRIWLDTIFGRAPLKASDININNISPLDLLALDWEVVP